MFIVTFIRVFAEFFRVVVVIPRWDHRLKDPERIQQNPNKGYYKHAHSYENFYKC
ncbi:hypothetical protein [Thermococcus sp. PK]|uniref:hypothetical protein n=1 Tax=Thermococcus sp. PK TaxID=913025 RepID=UPI0012EC3BF1|nr:hypothetical protein [Thermococcus sp. PK]